MQNRLATAILMAVGGNLANREVSGKWNETDAGEFLEDIGNTIQKLLKGEELKFSDYPPMQLTGSNVVASAYGNAAAEFLKEDTISYDQGGYRE